MWEGGGGSGWGRGRQHRFNMHQWLPAVALLGISSAIGYWLLVQAWSWGFPAAWGVRRISLVRLCLGPRRSGSLDCAVGGQPVGVPPPPW